MNKIAQLIMIVFFTCFAAQCYADDETCTESCANNNESLFSELDSPPHHDHNDITESGNYTCLVKYGDDVIFKKSNNEDSNWTRVKIKHPETGEQIKVDNYHPFWEFARFYKDYLYVGSDDYGIVIRIKVTDKNSKWEKVGNDLGPNISFYSCAFNDGYLYFLSKKSVFIKNVDDHDNISTPWKIISTKIDDKKTGIPRIFKHKEHIYAHVKDYDALPGAKCRKHYAMDLYRINIFSNDAKWEKVYFDDDVSKKEAEDVSKKEAEFALDTYNPACLKKLLNHYTNRADLYSNENFIYFSTYYDLLVKLDTTDPEAKLVIADPFLFTCSSKGRPSVRCPYVEDVLVGKKNMEEYIKHNLGDFSAEYFRKGYQVKHFSSLLRIIKVATEQSQKTVALEILKDHWLRDKDRMAYHWYYSDSNWDYMPHHVIEIFKAVDEHIDDQKQKDEVINMLLNAKPETRSDAKELVTTLRDILNKTPAGERHEEISKRIKKIKWEWSLSFSLLW